MAKLYFRYGAMNSGKSTALMQVAHNYEEQGMRVLILKPKVDTKGSGDLVSRLGVRLPQGLPRLHPASGAGPHHRGDEDHLHLRPQGHLQLPQGQRSLRL